MAYNGRATLMDAFNAAGHFTQQTLGYMDEANRYKYDTILYEQSIEREKIENELINDYTRIDENGENVFQQNSDLYEKHVDERLAQWRAAAQEAGNGKNYYLDRLKRMDAQFTEAMRQRKDAAALQSGKQRAVVAYQKEQNTIDNAGWDIPTTLAAKIESHNRYNSINAMDAVTAQKDKTAIYNTMFEKARNINIGSMTTSEAFEALDNNIKTLEEAAKKYLPEGESLDNYLDSKQEKLNDARQSLRLAIWKRNYHELDTLDNEYRRIASDAIKTENVGLMNTAINMWRQGSKLREQAMESSEFNPDDGSKIIEMFPIFDKLFDVDGSGRSGSKIKLEDKIKNWRTYYIDSVVEGRMAVEEGRSAFINDFGTLAEETGMGIDEMERLYAKETKFFAFWDDAIDALKTQDPGYKAAFESLDVYLDEWKKKAKTPEETALRHSQGKKVALLLYDTILDAKGSARLSPEEIQKEAARLTGLLVDEKISFIRETAENSREFKVGVDSDKDFGKAVFEMEQNPWARFVIGSGGSAKTYTFGDKKYQEQFENAALDKFSTITGKPLADLKIGHSKEGQFDEAAELNIIVTNEGKENETYRFKSDKDGNYWIEKKTDNVWERDTRYNITAKEAEKQQWEKSREEHAKAQEKAEKDAAEKGAQTTFEMLEKETSPDKRKALAKALQGDIFNPVSPDEFWKRGINPNSAEEVKQIPAKEWDRILAGMTASEQTIQKNKWQAMGISRGNK